MARDFCEHLEEYGVLYGRAEASYRNCVNLMEAILGSMVEPSLADPSTVDPSTVDPSLVATLRKALSEWVTETATVREEFQDLVAEGAIELIRNTVAGRSFQQDRSPICAECRAGLPRLEFPDFHWDEEGGLSFQGKPLPEPPDQKQDGDAAPASVAVS